MKVVKVSTKKVKKLGLSSYTMRYMMDRRYFRHLPWAVGMSSLSKSEISQNFWDCFGNFKPL